LPEGPAKGTVLSKDTIEQVLDEYYELRGWDKRTGLPTKEKLIELGLYNVAEHLHSGIDYVTPEQCHRGLRDQIVSRRKSNLNNQRRFRKEVNRQKQNILTDDMNALILNLNQFSACSVIHL